MEHHETVYAFIGQRIRERRKVLNLNPSELAELTGFSYQQVQRYETGAGPMPVDKLLLFAKILNVSPGYFYEGIKIERTKRPDGHIVPREQTEPLRILLVEDSPSDVTLFRTALEACAGQVDLHVIYKAETVMEFLLGHEDGRKMPDIVMLDLYMPCLNGLELLRAIKKHPRTQELPVIVLTGSIDPNDMLESYREGAAGFIQKSVSMDDYMESLDIVVKYWSKTVALPCV